MAYPRRITLHARKRQIKDIYGNDVYYAGPNPYSLSVVMGSIDNPWIDLTDYIGGLQNLELDWAAEDLDPSSPALGRFTPIKGVTGTLQFEREAYYFLKSHLIDDVAGALNQVEVRITDTSCGNYTGYVIKSTQLEWCEYNALCVYDLNLKQIEDYTNCLERTVISDNWQGWFQSEPLHGKKHPRFGYCIEKRPTWTLVLLWVLSSLLAYTVSLLYTALFPLVLAVWAIRVIIYGIAVALNFVIGVVNTIIDFINTLGAGIPNIPTIPEPDPGPAPVTPVEVFLGWANQMMEVAGCGREHPAPLIRDYILNVCEKCGIVVDDTTVPLFFATTLTETRSDNAVYTSPNPYYNACYLDARAKRGVRKFRKINFFEPNADPDTTTYFQPENAPIDSGAIFLDKICKHFASQWWVQVDTLGIPHLYLRKSSELYETTPLYNFGTGAVDRQKIVGGICYEPQDLKVPAFCSYLYPDDPADKCSFEVSDFYNGIQSVTFNNTTINPIFNGELNIKSEIAATRFLCDGSGPNYLYDALQAVYSLVVVGPITFLATELSEKIEQIANYRILLQSETVSLSRIIIWDGDTDNPTEPNYLNATAVRDTININGTVHTIGKSGYPATVPGITVPDINPLYPTMVPDIGGTTFVPASVPAWVNWQDNHPPQTSVNMQFPSFPIPTGVYAVTNIFGATLIPAAAILVNYPMYCEPHYKETLWDRFWYIKDPYRQPRLNKRWSVKIQLCCEDIERLRLTGSVNEQMLLKPVILDTPFYNIGIITRIRVSYKTDNEEGMYIELSGIV